MLLAGTGSGILECQRYLATISHLASSTVTGAACQDLLLQTHEANKVSHFDTFIWSSGEDRRIA